MSTSLENTSTGRAKQPPPAPLRRPLQSCPACGSWQLQPVVEAEARVDFLCGSCSRCWRVELGYVRRVHPDRCDGCPHPQRCAAVYAEDHPPA